ncbi:MAG: hypothetical protein U0840_13055 [Gemmataceae bacterium]
MVHHRTAVLRGVLAMGLVIALLGVSGLAVGQPSDEVIDRLLKLSKEKQRAKAGPGDDALRGLQVQRYNVALEELRLRCEDFKRNLTPKVTVFEAGRNLLQAELELQTRPADRVKVLEEVVELMRWYEKRMEQREKDNLITRADLRRVQYTRLSLEIDLAKLKQSLAKSESAPGPAPGKKEPASKPAATGK